MARGRMLNHKISQNKAFAEIANTIGCEGALFLTWLISHLDREGRVHGDPEVLKGLVCPRIAGVTPELIRSSSGKAHELGLIEWYESEGEFYISFPTFEANQAGLRKDREQPSNFPAPSGVTPSILRSNSGVTPAEGKGREGKRKEVKETNTGRTASQPDVSVSVSEVLKHYLEAFPRREQQARSEKSRQKVKARLKEKYTVDQLKKAIDGNLKSQYHVENNHNSIELIFRDASKVDQFISYADKPPNNVGSNWQTQQNDFRFGWHPGSQPEEFGDGEQKL